MTKCVWGECISISPGMGVSTYQCTSQDESVLQQLTSKLKTSLAHQAGDKTSWKPRVYTYNWEVASTSLVFVTSCAASLSLSLPLSLPVSLSLPDPMYVHNRWCSCDQITKHWKRVLSVNHSCDDGIGDWLWKLQQPSAKLQDGLW